MLKKFNSLARRAGDEFFFELLIDILDQINNSINQDYDVFYIPVITEHQLVPIKHSKKSTSIICKEVLLAQNSLIELFESSPNKKFIVFSDSWIPDTVSHLTNVKIINWGPDFLLQNKEYYNLTCVENKNINSNQHWINLVLNSRIHRTMAAVFIKGRGLDKYGQLRISPYPIQDINSWEEYCPWPQAKELKIQWGKTLSRGFSKMKRHVYVPPSFDEVYPEPGICDNATNFDKKLRPLYESTLVEIVSETMFEEIGHFVTEKFLNSVYGLNLPIMLSQHGVVDYLRTLGFDMFDDVVDHKYDTISDPLERLICAINDNSKLLMDQDYARQSWAKCQNRLIDNYHFAKNNVHNIVRQRVLDQVPDVVSFMTQQT